MKLLHERNGTFVNVRDLKETLNSTISDLGKTSDTDTKEEVEIRIKTLQEVTELLSNLINKI